VVGGAMSDSAGCECSVMVGGTVSVSAGSVVVGGVVGGASGCSVSACSGGKGSV
jgi:hypothetical protein